MEVANLNSEENLGRATDMLTEVLRKQWTGLVVRQVTNVLHMHGILFFFENQIVSYGTER